MTHYLKSTVMVIAGVIWILFAVLFGLFLLQYLVGGAGLQAFGFYFAVSSFTVLVGLVHFTGFIAAVCLCLAIGMGILLHGLVPAPATEKKAAPQPIVCDALSIESEPGFRCVCCRIPLARPVHICPDCGWTQP